MKSGSYNLSQKDTVNEKNICSSFAYFYKSAAEISTILSDNHIASDCKDFTKTHKPKVKPAFNSQISPRDSDTINNLNARHSSEIGFQSNSKAQRKIKNPAIKSIMKHPPDVETDSTNIDNISYVSEKSKRKKRNKSVSFMLEDNEENVAKKSKSAGEISKKVLDKEECGVGSNKSTTSKDYKFKKNKKTSNVDCGEKISDAFINVDQNKNKVTKKPSFKKNKSQHSQIGEVVNNIDSATLNEEQASPEHTNIKIKKKKGKKHKSNLEATDGEPQAKTRKKEMAVLAEDLDKISIGDNTHTITSLLTKMTVNKKEIQGMTKKNKQNPVTESCSEPADLEIIKEDKERVKWNKRKWNKDKKGVTIEDNLLTSLIVDNLPISIIMNYKKLLSDHFQKFGLVTKVGVVEVYPSDEPAPVFTTTIHFDTEDAATQALEEDNTEFHGSYIYVKRPLPATQTTIVLRSYSKLTEQTICSTFAGCGKIRSIKHIVKGKNSSSTAFILFDGPEAVEKALKAAENTKIGGKKMFVSRYEVRIPPKKNFHKMSSKDSKNPDKYKQLSTT